MDIKEKLLLVVIGALMFFVAVRYGMTAFTPNVIEPESVQVSERTSEEEEAQKPDEIEKIYVNVFFIGQNENHEEVYKAVKREYNPEIDGNSKLKYAMDSLITGPKQTERAKGVYTEIPESTDLIYVKEFPDKAIVNLSSEFETGGGTDSLYKRLYQVIKTAKRNSDVPVYLYIEGKRADVIGGDGIMLSQPLSDRSLDG